MKLRARVAATLLLTSACMHAVAQSITPESLATEIRTSGAREVLRKYFDTPEWEQQIIPGVKSGSTAWLAVARDLSAVADAAPSEELSLALYAALPVRPFAVLSVLGSKHGFEAESLCNMSFEAELPEEGALPYITRVRSSLRSASTPQERRIAAACRRGLARAEESVKRPRLK
jgi:hypothetical protein